ncbi:MAG TPA: CoA transferase [Methylomirabilota bacterium]|nr:CoA transferase [Methylomirabilota bacterium]
MTEPGAPDAASGRPAPASSSPEPAAGTAPPAEAPSRDGKPAERWADWIRAAEDPRRASEHPEALDGLLVLDCAVGHYGGHVLGGFLGELGAEVIKIEPPGGDPARAWGPPDVEIRGEGLAYLAEGRNRHYATLDLTRAEGQAMLRQLAAKPTCSWRGSRRARWTGGGSGIASSSA